MVFSSSIFIFVFLPVCLAGYYLLKGRQIRNMFLLIMSLIFYAWGEPRVVFLLILSIVLNYTIAIFIEKKRNTVKLAKTLFIFDIAVNLGILFVFKYLVFFTKNLNTLFGIQITVPDIALPIGISFFTFQAISYVADVYTQRSNVQTSIYRLALYISFFPQLIAGPIVRYNSIEEQIDSRRESLELFCSGIRRFTIGLAKKAILANLFSVYTDQIFNYSVHERTILLAWFGVLGYCLQIYFDFSGYSDMAIGLAKMFGFILEENFDYPYISNSASEFWRRWHISLGRWFRDYVYIPLGGSKKGQVRHIINLFIVWLLTGIWHGASWNFVLFGLYYFVFITAEHMLRNIISKERFRGIWFNIISHIYTLIVIYFGWLIFRVTGISTLAGYLSDMFGFSGNHTSDAYTLSMIVQYMPVVCLGIILSTPILRVIYSKLNSERIWVRFSSDILFLTLFIVSVSFVVSSSYNPFIYFNF